jgi:hypothetical protein
MYIVGADSVFDHDLEKALLNIKCNTLLLLLLLSLGYISFIDLAQVGKKIFAFIFFKNLVACAGKMVRNTVHSHCVIFGIAKYSTESEKLKHLLAPRIQRLQRSGRI